MTDASIEHDDPITYASTPRRRRRGVDVVGTFSQDVDPVLAQEAVSRGRDGMVQERLGITPDEVDGGHCAMLSRPREVAAYLERAVSETLEPWQMRTGVPAVIRSASQAMSAFAMRMQPCERAVPSRSRRLAPPRPRRPTWPSPPS